MLPKPVERLPEKQLAAALAEGRVEGGESAADGGGAPSLPGVQLTRARDTFAWIHEREEESLNCIEEISSRPMFAGVWRIRGVQNSSRLFKIVQAVSGCFRASSALNFLELP